MRGGLLLALLLATAPLAERARADDAIGDLLEASQQQGTAPPDPAPLEGRKRPGRAPEAPTPAPPRPGQPQPPPPPPPGSLPARHGADPRPLAAGRGGGRAFALVRPLQPEHAEGRPADQGHEDWFF